MIPLSLLLKISLFLPLLFFPLKEKAGIPHPETSRISDRWITLSDGISFKQQNTDKTDLNILITFGGFLQPEESVRKWSDALCSVKNTDLGIGFQIAVKGPLNDYYQQRELDLNKLIDFTDSLIALKRFAESDIYVIGYSSGVFVFHEMLNLLNKRQEDVKSRVSGRITYFSLDGAMGKNQGIFLTEENTRYLKKIYGVYAESKTAGIRSARNNDVIDLVNYYKNISELVVVNSDNSGCLKGAKWCVHESLIIKYPPLKSGLSGNYNYDFGNRGENVTDEYLNYVKRAGKK
ncbi:MAG: hypothetical protein HUU43_14245 [Ignavibacteriaceae bacterium]|nr:hypothetical protein [Ignavibacteriaceae bacterium]